MNTEASEEANIALIETWGDIQAKINADHQLAERLQAHKQEELSIEERATLFQQLLEKRRKHFAAKRAEEKRNKPPIKAQQRKIMCTYLKNMEGYKLNDLKLKEFDSIQEMFDRAFKRQKVEDDKETTELKQCLEIIPDEEEVTIDAIPLAVKSPIAIESRKKPSTPNLMLEPHGDKLPKTFSPSILQSYAAPIIIIQERLYNNNLDKTGIHGTELVTTLMILK
ncbi:hypothetical protein Tco_0322184 [Tanacetum coccineum]